jgi:hypothetical protein
MDDGVEIRRRRDGSIDIAFYVARARRLRAQANAELLRSMWRNAPIFLRELRRCGTSQTMVPLGRVLSKRLCRQGQQNAPIPHSMERA